MKSLTETKDWEDRTSKKVYPTPWLSRMDYELMNLLNPFLRQKKGGELIEMGCGGSYMLPYFGKKYGFKVYGVEFEKERLQKAKSNVELSGIRNSVFLFNDFTKSLPLGWVDKFDVIYSGGVVEHFSPPSEMIKTFATYLKHDGLMINTAPHLKSVWGRMIRNVSPSLYSSFVCMDLEDFCEQHRQAGLKIVYASYFRWLDFGVVGFDWLPVWLMKLVYANIMIFDIFLNFLFRLYTPHLPESLYADMVVVSHA